MLNFMGTELSFSIPVLRLKHGWLERGRMVETEFEKSGSLLSLMSSFWAFQVSLPIADLEETYIQGWSVVNWKRIKYQNGYLQSS